MYGADSKDEGSGSIDEEEDAREGVALMEGALEELEQARDLLASMEQKVRDCKAAAIDLTFWEAMSAQQMNILFATPE